MSARDTGGPAFPKAHDNNMPETQGMTLRDHFAGLAMPLAWDNCGAEGGFDRIARNAYALADAMLEARKA